MPSNREISRQFNLFAELLLLHQKDERLAALLSGAAYRLRSITSDVTKLDKKELAKLFKPALLHLITELKETGTISILDELVQLTPSGLFDMMRIRGLGGKKLAALWKAGIDSPESLLEACKKNQVSKIPGFGVKTEQNILANIESLNSFQNRFHYAAVADHALRLVTQLQKVFKTKYVSLCGEIRRQSTTVADIELITVIPQKKLLSTSLKKFLLIKSAEKNVTTGHTSEEIPATIYHVSKDDFSFRLFTHTGNEAHVEKVITKLKSAKDFRSEEALYKKAGLPFIIPEMREDLAEWNFKKSASSLITTDDIKGVVHNHTTWSDGIDTLEDFVQACVDQKYEYVVISDHSKNAHYAGGLKEDKVIKQLQAIDKLNKQLAPFKIFKSTECDILVSGELDYNPDILQKFDLVIVSVHQLLKMNEPKATARLIKAIENPYTTVLGHMTGRQLLIRPGYPVDFKKVIDACAANHVVIEMNANPYRLDMDWLHIPYALERGVMISINPDAHSIGEIDNIRWGVSAARKGGLTKAMTWNAMPLKKIIEWLKKKS